MFSNIEKNMEVGLAAIPPWLKELNDLEMTFYDLETKNNRTTVSAMKKSSEAVELSDL